MLEKKEIEAVGFKRTLNKVELDYTRLQRATIKSNSI